MRATRRGTPDSAARLKALTRRAYTATAGHLDLDDEAGREFDRIISGTEPARRSATRPAAPARRFVHGQGDGAPGRRSDDTHADAGHRSADTPADAGRGSADTRADARRRASDMRTDGAPGRGFVRRWVVSGRAVVVVLAVAAALAGVVVARAIALGPSEPVPAVVRATDTPGPALADDGAQPASAGGSDDGTVPNDLAADATVAPRSPSADAVGNAAVAGGSSPHVAGAGTGHGSVVVVHVAGAVTDPGVVELPAGARVGEAIDAAGGAEPSAELAAVNLARPVQDGEQVYVPEVGEVEPGSAATATGTAGAGGAAPGAGGEVAEGEMVDLNTADLAGLDTLPGVGPAIAQRILDWRAANGPFHTVEELLEVSGIGPATLERLRERVRV